MILLGRLRTKRPFVLVCVVVVVHRLAIIIPVIMNIVAVGLLILVASKSMPIR